MIQRKESQIMNVLLVVPRFYANIYEPCHFPVGMAYISSYLKVSGFSVKVLNLNFIQGSVFDILNDFLASNEIDILETGGLVTHYHLCKEIVDCSKKIDPAIITIIGGGLVTGSPKVIMSGIFNADYAVYGEGEITNVELLSALDKGMPIENVMGIYYRSTDGNNLVIKNTKMRPEIDDLDSLPMPDYEGLMLDELLKYAPKKYLTLSTGRSCIFNCTFCFHTSGKKYRQRSLDNFFKELDYVVNKYGIDNIYITDEMFAYDKKRLYDFCNRIKKYSILWAVQLRVDIITKELIEILKDSGCIILSLGLESADDNVLKSMRKGITRSQIENALKLCYELGIDAHGAFIFGDIAEDRISVKNTIDWWKAHRQYNVGLNMISVYPGTSLYKYAVENGIIKNELSFIEDGCQLINVSKLKNTEYIELANYLRKLQIPSLFDTLVDIDVLSTDEKQRKIKVSGKCKKCGAMNIVLKHAIKISSHKCSNCGNDITLTPMAIFGSVICTNIQKMMTHSTNIVLWEANQYSEDLVNNLNQEIANKIIVVDKDKTKTGTMIGNKKVLYQCCLPFRDSSYIVCDYAFETFYKNYLKSISGGKVTEVFGLWDLINK